MSVGETWQKLEMLYDDLLKMQNTNKAWECVR